MVNREIKNICVVGAGNMGHQIALSAAIAGFKVICMDLNKEILDKAISFTEKYLPERVSKGKLTEEQAKAAANNISFTDDLTNAAKDADLVIEAVVEKIEVKRKVFAELDEICPPHAILTSNSSYIVSSKIADVTKRPDQVCNMHFFVPALVMKLVEVVKGPHTSQETADTVMQVAEKMGKIPVLLQKEIYGFLVNRIVAATKNEALYLYDMGIASYEDIDTAVVNALGHPMGPFRLMDLTGIDLSYYIATEKYQESGDPKDKPSPVLVEKFIKKEWGRKVGKGFYDYSEGGKE
ncbi:MAG: 3-hydroxyacyl-CoA dehydrogenase family protein [Bacillota bacterium]|nr:3-hydroxyacyl-CoA dehydrogenase family protein [Bacillota bacterium]